MTGLPDEGKCRVCGAEGLAPILSGYKGQFEDAYSLVKCGQCSFVSLRPLPSAELLARYYDLDYWSSGQAGSSGMMATFFRFRMAGIIRDIRRFIGIKSRVLDWGAGDGSLLRLLGRAGYDAWGIDRYSVPSVQDRLINASIEEADFPPEHFEAITCLHVLEHLADPAASMKSALSLLKPGGLLVLETPNISSLGFKLFKERWQPLEIPTHLNHFSSQSLETLLRILGGTEIVKRSFYSPRSSAAAATLSLFPALTPKKVRQAAGGRYPLPLLLVYLGLQTAALPPVLLAAAAGQGSIMRLYIRKSG